MTQAAKAAGLARSTVYRIAKQDQRVAALLEAVQGVSRAGGRPARRAPQGTLLGARAASQAPEADARAEARAQRERELRALALEELLAITLDSSIAAQDRVNAGREIVRGIPAEALQAAQVLPAVADPASPTITFTAGEVAERLKVRVLPPEEASPATTTGAAQ